MARPRFVLAPLITGRCWLVNVPSPQSVPEPRLLVGHGLIPGFPWTDGNCQHVRRRSRMVLGRSSARYLGTGKITM